MAYNSRNLLIIIVLLLLGIFGFLVYERSRHKTLGDKIDAVTEEIGDQIDGSATSR